MKPDSNLIQKINDSYERFMLEHFGTNEPAMSAETAAQLTHAIMFVLASKLVDLIGSSCKKEDYPNIIKMMGIQFEMLLTKFLRNFDEDQANGQSERGVH